MSVNKVAISDIQIVHITISANIWTFARIYLLSHICKSVSQMKIYTDCMRFVVFHGNIFFLAILSSWNTSYEIYSLGSRINSKQKSNADSFSTKREKKKSMCIYYGMCANAQSKLSQPNMGNSRKLEAIVELLHELWNIRGGEIFFSFPALLWLFVLSSFSIFLHSLATVFWCVCIYNLFKFHMLE